MTKIHLVVMGVAGCGKTSIARALSQRLGWEFAEADDFHPLANIAKMSAGIPLTDEDRWPWLASIAAWTKRQDDAGTSTVVTCSALRRAYRDIIRSVPGRTVFIHLDGSPSLIRARMEARPGHFMPASLLPSQFATLEPLQADEDGFAVPIDADVDDVVADIISRLPALTRPPTP